MFVTKVRGIGGGNSSRFLLVPGYNTNIDQTVSSNFTLPTYNGSSDKIMVEVHFYDPYDFTLNTDSTKTSLTLAERNAIGTQFAKLKEAFIDKGIPVVIDEFGAVDKGNYNNIATYISTVVTQAQSRGIGYVYWDNGYTGDFGFGLWNRYTYAKTALGEAVLPVLTSTAD